MTIQIELVCYINPAGGGFAEIGLDYFSGQQNTFRAIHSAANNGGGTVNLTKTLRLAPGDGFRFGYSGTTFNNTSLAYLNNANQNIDPSAVLTITRLA